ncbi:MAG TPA: arsenate reductase (glutaredoxin) [Bacteroidia bacterium]|jgi:arsenate reductase|nr:arsenate reductase (glutaredoxin) [Bacteroidia bacterium]
MDKKITIWHKSTCNKSCEVMNVLKSEHIMPDVFEYLETPPTENQLRDVLKKLGIPAEELIRKKEKIYHEKFEGKKMNEEKWIKAMLKYPILIERPIVIKGNKAVIGRPTEKIFELIR